MLFALSTLVTAVIIIAVVAVLLIIIGAAIGMHNSLVTLKNGCEEAWSGWISISKSGTTSFPIWWKR